MSFDPMFFHLQLEGFITRSCICNGFNELLGATADQRGRYYTAFFQLSIGIERIEKLAVILDHWIHHNLDPIGEETLKRKFGHDLLKLHDKASAIAQSRTSTGSISFNLMPLHRRMLEFLTAFANGARYANLTSLASGKPFLDPLEGWQNIMWEVFKGDVPEGQKSSILKEADAWTLMLQDRGTVLAHDFKNRPLNVASKILLEVWLKAVSPYTLWNLVILIFPITELACQLADEVRNICASKGIKDMTVPHMDEFYDFLCLDKEYVLSR